MKNIIILVTSIFLLASCGGSNDKAAQLKELKSQQASLSQQIKDLEKELAATDTSKAKSKLVEVMPLTSQEFKRYVEIQGKVDADQNVTVTPQMMGTVKAIYVNEGDQVSPGQVLAEIDDAVMRQSLEELKSGLELATILFAKQENLWKQNIGSEVQYLQAKNQKESLEKKMKTFQDQIDLYKIKSPIFGTVDDVMLKIGQGVAPGVPSVRVVNTTKLKVKAEVAERFASSIKDGSNVMIYFPDLKKEFPATVSFRSKVIDELNRTFIVEVNIASSPDYHPNMIAVVKINDYSNPNAIVVPVNTVQESESGTYVFIALEQNGKTIAQKKDVVLGNNYNGNVEILSGLAAGDKIVTTGLEDLNNGMLLETNN